MTAARPVVTLLRVLAVAFVLTVIGTVAWVVKTELFGDPTIPNAQLVDFAKQLEAGQTRAQVVAIAHRYDRLLNYGPPTGRLYVATPNRFDADNWLALIDFDEKGRILSVGFGTVDAAPLLPRYPARPGMPANRCFGLPTQCPKQ